MIFTQVFLTRLICAGRSATGLYTSDQAGWFPRSATDPCVCAPAITGQPEPAATDTARLSGALAGQRRNA